MINIIMLIRVSTDRQDVARQRADAKRLEKEFGANIVRTLELHGVSGTATLEHHEIQRILAELSDPAIDGIGLSALDRLLRPAKRFGQTAMLDRFIEERKRIWSVKEAVIDPATDEGNAKCWQACAQAGGEWRDLRRRTMDQRLLNLDAGILDHGMACYGMLNMRTDDGRKLVIDPAMTNVEGISKRQVVEMVYGWRRTGWKISKIVNTLNAKGILSTGYWGKKDPETGKAVWVPPGLWTRQTVLQMVRNSTYCGEHKRMGRVIKCEAIINKELWDEVQRVNENAPERTTGRAPKHHYLLSHFLWDKNGHRMCSTGNSGWVSPVTGERHQYPRYGCHHHTDPRSKNNDCDTPTIHAAKIEPIAWGEIWATISDPKVLIVHATAYYKAREKNTSATAKLEKEVKALEKSIAGMQYMVEKGAADPVTTTGKILAAQKRMRQVQADLKEAGKVVFIPSERQAEVALRRIADTRNEPENFEHRRSVLESIQDLRIVYEDGELTITGSIPMPLPEASSGSRRNSNKCMVGVGADAKAKGQHRHRGKSGILAQQPGSVAQVEDHALQGGLHAGVAHFFDHARGRAVVGARPTAGFLG